MNLKTASTLPKCIKKARWIWPDSHHWDLHNGYALFRHSFRLSSVPANAPLYITADQSYQLYINGRYVCRGPARGFQRSWPLDRINVRPWLKKGKNLIAVRAHNPGFSNFQYLSQCYAGLLVAAQWGKVHIQSDETWLCRRQNGVRRDMVPTSVQLFCEEAIDLNEEEPDWMSPDYNDSSWNASPYSTACNATPPTAAWNAMPWYSLEPRDIPMLEEMEISPGAVIGEAKGQSIPGYSEVRNLSLLRFREGLSHQPTKGEIAKITFGSSKKGRWQSVLIDLGKLHVGSVILDIAGARGGEMVECHHYETIDAETLTPDYIPDAHCRMAFSNRLICRKGNNRHAFYHALGYRYMILTVRDNTSPLKIKTSLRTSVYPMEQKGVFKSSDTSLEAIWETCAWTQRMCSLDAYVDTPWREQAQWWGDARVQAWNTFHLNGDDRLLRRGIRQIASQSTPDGVTYGHAPTMAHSCILPDFTLVWMLTLWDHYWQTGSLEAFQENQPTLIKALDYFTKWLDPKTGLLRYDERFWLFLDWTSLRKEGYSSVYSLWYLHALDRMSQLYQLTGDEARAESLKRNAGKLRRNLRKLIGPDGLMRDGYDAKGRIDAHCSVHAQTLCLVTGLAGKHEKIMLEKSLLKEVTGKNQSQVRPSAYWITYIYEALIERGFGPQVVEDIRSRWAPMVEHGTTWENFQSVKGHESFSHAWSAHPLFHLMRILGGIRQTAPAWKEIICQPNFIGDHADVSIPSPRGRIRCHWTRKGNTITGQLQLPKDVTARLCLPGQEESVVTVRHHFELNQE